jgi:hypothetical protein
MLLLFFVSKYNNAIFDVSKHALSFFSASPLQYFRFRNVYHFKISLARLHQGHFEEFGCLFCQQIRALQYNLIVNHEHCMNLGE